MDKKDFLNCLKLRLKNLPYAEVQKTIQYYSEIIDDRIEDGMSEIEAVKAIGNIDDIIENTISSVSITSIVKASINKSKEKSRNKELWIILAIIGFPIWLPLIIAFFGLIFAFVISISAIIFALFSIVISFFVGGIIGLIVGVVSIFVVSIPYGLFQIGSSLVIFGLSLLLSKPIYLISMQLILFVKYVKNKIKLKFVK